MKKKSENSISPERFKSLIKASLFAIAADTLLISLKYFLANITGNPVLFADALHSAGDFAVTFSVLLSIVVNYKFKDSKIAIHAEGIVALFISFFLIFGSIQLLIGVVTESLTYVLLTNDVKLVVAIAGIFIAMVIALYMSRYKRQIGEKHDSFAFIAEGAHTYSDFFTSAGVWVTLILSFFGIHLEKLMTFFVGLLVLKIGLSLFVQSLIFFNLNLKELLFDKIYSFISQRFSKEFDFLKIKVVARLNDAWSFVKSIFNEEWIIENRWKIFKYNIAFVIFLYIFTGFYMIVPSQRGVEFVLGSFSENNESGLHYNFPVPFGNTVVVDSGMTLRVESGFRTNWDFKGKEPEAYLWEFAHSAGRMKKVSGESITITGDENIVDANFLCYYRIEDPVLYSMKIDNAREILRSIFTFEVHAAIGHYQLEKMITVGRSMIQEEIKKNMISAMVKVPLGVEIVKVFMLDAHPPIEVVPKYRAVASAREKKDEIIHRANAYSNDLIPKSRGKAVADTISAEGYFIEKINSAIGKTENFKLREKNFRAAAFIHKNRLWWENIEKVLTGKRIYVIPSKSRKRFYLQEKSRSTVSNQPVKRNENTNSNINLEEYK